METEKDLAPSPQGGEIAPPLPDTPSEGIVVPDATTLETQGVTGEKPDTQPLTSVIPDYALRPGEESFTQNPEIAHERAKVEQAPNLREKVRIAEELGLDQAAEKLRNQIKEHGEGQEALYERMRGVAMTMLNEALLEGRSVTQVSYIEAALLREALNWRLSRFDEETGAFRRINNFTIDVHSDPYSARSTACSVTVTFSLNSDNASPAAPVERGTQ